MGNQNEGYHFGGPHNKDYTIVFLGLYWGPGSPYSGKLPHHAFRKLPVPSCSSSSDCSSRCSSFRCKDRGPKETQAVVTLSYSSQVCKSETTPMLQNTPQVYVQSMCHEALYDDPPLPNKHSETAQRDCLLLLAYFTVLDSTKAS